MAYLNLYKYFEHNCRCNCSWASKTQHTLGVSMATTNARRATEARANQRGRWTYHHHRATHVTLSRFCQTGVASSRQSSLCLSRENAIGLFIWLSHRRVSGALKPQRFVVHFITSGGFADRPDTEAPRSRNCDKVLIILVFSYCHFCMTVRQKVGTLSANHILHISQQLGSACEDYGKGNIQFWGNHSNYSKYLIDWATANTP